MTMDEAEEAGLLATALRAMPELLNDVEAEATGELEKGHTRWDVMALEAWGKSATNENDHEHIGPDLRLPLGFARRALEAVHQEIGARLIELGVTP